MVTGNMLPSAIPAIRSSGIAAIHATRSDGMVIGFSRVTQLIHNLPSKVKDALRGSAGFPPTKRSVELGGPVNRQSRLGVYFSRKRSKELRICLCGLLRSSCSRTLTYCY